MLRPKHNLNPTLGVKKRRVCPAVCDNEPIQPALYLRATLMSAHTRRVGLPYPSNLDFTFV